VCVCVCLVYMYDVMYVRTRNLTGYFYFDTSMKWWSLMLPMVSVQLSSAAVVGHYVASHTYHHRYGMGMGLPVLVHVQCMLH
jgi:hypothetical protein